MYGVFEPILGGIILSYAIVFAGGGGKGSYQIGVIKALEKLRLAQKFIAASGTSVGALNAALFAQNNIALAENVWRNISYKKILPIQLNEEMNSIASKDGLKRIIDVNLNYQKIKESKVNLYAMCTEVQENKNFFRTEYIGRLVNLKDLDEETMKEYLIASASLPVVFGKTYIRDKCYLDGGILEQNNSPYDAMLNMGYKKVFVIELNSGLTYCKNINGADILFLRPSENIGDFIDGTIDFNNQNVTYRINLGYNDTMENLEIIKQFFKQNKKDENIKSIIDKKIKGMFY